MGTVRNLSNGGDVVLYLKEQHDQIKALFTRVLDATGADRDEAFRELRRMLAVHETAEEEVVHPLARSLPGGDVQVTARLREENLAKKALVDLERLNINSPEFITKLRALQADVLAHAESEEQLEFDRLGTRFNEDQLKRMRKAVELAESVAPTRPHAGIESRAANVLVGPFMSMVDRARDALHSKS
jgi:hemerythrin superfamily protein